MSKIDNVQKQTLGGGLHWLIMWDSALGEKNCGFLIQEQFGIGTQKLTHKWNILTSMVQKESKTTFRNLLKDNLLTDTEFKK